jgi:hypothetical protein
LMISSMFYMYPTAVICLFWWRDCFCIAPRFWMLCQIFKKWWTLAILYNFLSSTGLFIYKPFLVFVVSDNILLPAKMPILGQENCLPTSFFTKDLTSDFWQPPANNISGKRNMGHNSHTMWYNRKYVWCLIGAIGGPWVGLWLLVLPVSYVQYSKFTTNPHWVGVINIAIWK